MSTYYQKNWKKLLNLAKEYYENNKEKLIKQTKNKYRKLSNKEKDKKKENMLEIDIKIQRLKECQRNYRKAKNKHKKFYLYFFTLYKNGTKSLDFWWKVYYQKYIS